MKPIADTGVIVALLAADDPCHAWAAEAFRRHSPLLLDFNLAEQMPRVLALVTKYADRPMDLADACVVRMTELNERCKVWTVDRGDFLAYRRHGRQPVPYEFPPNG